MRQPYKRGDHVRIHEEECVDDRERSMVWVVQEVLPEGGVILKERDQPGYEWVAHPLDLVLVEHQNGGVGA